MHSHREKGERARGRERGVNGHDSLSNTAPFTLSISISLVIETYRPNSESIRLARELAGVLEGRS